MKNTFSFIIDPTDLMYNVTAIYDKNFVIVENEFKIIKRKVYNTRLVLDYFTASQQGMCTIVSRSCCNYFSMILKLKMLPLLRKSAAVKARIWSYTH